MPSSGALWVYFCCSFLLTQLLIQMWRGRESPHQDVGPQTLCWALPTGSALVFRELRLAASLLSFDVGPLTSCQSGWHQDCSPTCHLPPYPNSRYCKNGQDHLPYIWGLSNSGRGSCPSPGGVIALSLCPVPPLLFGSGDTQQGCKMSAYSFSLQLYKQLP